MIGVTAIPGSVARLGDRCSSATTTSPALACLGAVIGFQIGLRAGPYAAVKWLKTGMSVLLVLVADSVSVPAVMDARLTLRTSRALRRSVGRAGFVVAVTGLVAAVRCSASDTARRRPACSS